MASAKQYKNVYTILEKVKKGEIQTHYKDSDGLFGKLQFYKRPDLIKPHIHYIDEARLKKIVDVAVTDMNSIKEEFGHFSKTVGFKKLDEDKRPDMHNFWQKLQDNYKKFPQHLKYDIFKMYYNKIDRLKFEERTAENQVRYKFLEKANNPVGKIMTEHSNLKSAVFTRNMMLYYLMQLTQLEYIDPNAAQDIQNAMQDGNDFNNACEQALDKLFNSQNSKNALDRAMDQAQTTCNQLDDNMEKDVQERMFEQASEPGNSNSAAKVSPDYIRTISAQLANIRMSMNSLKEKLKKILDKSTSYFSSRKITTYDDLFNAQDVSGLDEYELLHPKLRKIFAEDIQVKETKNVGKIDVYVDISGSMSSNCGARDEEGNHIRRIDFAKSMIAKLKEMDMLNEVYLFDTRVKKWRNDIMSIAMIDCGGGTTINTAVDSIVRNDRNALVITDAEDHCSIYSDKAFFIGLEGARFNGFASDVIRQYSQKGQVIIFDGSKISLVDQQGNTVSK